MITGFNTDVEYGGVTYHIQTEDKGIDTPIILSLVYDRGTILAAKRQPYDDLLEKGFDEKVLVDRLNKQHKTICAAIKKGRIQELKVHTDEKRNGKKAVTHVEAPSAGSGPLLDLAVATSQEVCKCPMTCSFVVTISSPMAARH